MRLIVVSAPLQADLAILDEIDSGLDIDALRDVANAVNGLRSDETGILLVTHYKVKELQMSSMRLLNCSATGSVFSEIEKTSCCHDLSSSQHQRKCLLSVQSLLRHARAMSHMPGRLPHSVLCIASLICWFDGWCFVTLQRLLEYIQPDYIHIMDNGRIIKTGDASLAEELEAGGYARITV